MRDSHPAAERRAERGHAPRSKSARRAILPPHTDAIEQEDRHATADHHDRERSQFAALQPGHQGRAARRSSRASSVSTRAPASSPETRSNTQTRQALANCQAILEAGGASLDDVIEVGVLLTDPADFAGLNEEYAHWFPSEPPTRYVAKLGVDLPGLLVSIRLTAYVA